MPPFVSSKENQLLNEFWLYVLEDLHTNQSLGTLKFTSADPAFVKETVERVRPPCLPFDPRNGNRPRDASDKGLLAAARNAASCNAGGDRSSTLAMLEETADEAFKVYMTHKTQCWFRR
jgi:hypothetical protein